MLSIQNQAFKSYEVIIVDGNSKDGTQQYLESLQPPFHYISETDEGVYDAMNKGIEKSKGQWLYFLGSDDQLYDSNVLMNIFKDDFGSEVDLIIGNIKYDSNGKGAHHLNKDGGIRKSNWSSRLWLTNSVHHQGVFYRRAVFENTSYDLSYKILADYDFNLRLFKQGRQAKLSNELIAFCGANGLSKDYQWLMYKEEIRLKISQSSPLLGPFFYVLAFLKYLLKKSQD